MTRRAGALAAAVLAAACTARVDYAGTEYRCPDGRTCPPGFSCVDQVCVHEAANGPDGAPGGADASPTPLVDRVSVPAGGFVMGCDPGADPGCPFDALPARAVTLPAFQLDRTEVTQAAYARCVAAGVCAPPGAGYDPAARPTHPVVAVSWTDAQAYCAWAGGRLPTEAEWERAARGADERTYPWGGAPPDCTRANYSNCGMAAKPVASAPAGASPVGAHDLAGNVEEWVADWYSSSYYFTGPDVDPQGPATGTTRVVRGGGFRSPSGALRTFVRATLRPDLSSDDLGFRCATR